MCPVDTVCTTFDPDTCAPTFNNGTVCDDGNACTAVSACINGACTAITTDCQNGGTCPSTGVCDCPANFTGDRCQYDVNECEASPSPCAGGSACSNTDGGFACNCLPGFVGSADGGCTHTGRAIRVAAFYDDKFRRAHPDVEATIERLILKTNTTMRAALTSPAPQVSVTLEAIMPLDPLPFTARRCNTPVPSRPACTGCWLSNVPADCSGPLSTRANEVDVQGMLSSFNQHVASRRPALVNATGMNVAVLFSGEDFASSVLELATLSSVCTSSGALVVQSAPSDVVMAAALIHGLGHTLGMSHDAAGDLYIMAPSVTVPPPTQFSPTSIGAANVFLLSSVSACMTAGGAHAWNTTRCGDGRVDTGEQCDTGGLASACCVACQLQPNCDCAVGACCVGGNFADAGTVCRPAANDCDVADTCDGQSTRCPDINRAPGMSCGDGGVCGTAECAPTRDDQCVAVNNGQLPTACPGATACNRLECRTTGGSCATYTSLNAANGTPCGNGNLCVDGVCDAPEALAFWSWSLGTFGACSGGTQSRTVTCVANTGASGVDALCPPPRPLTVRNCP